MSKSIRQHFKSGNSIMERTINGLTVTVNTFKEGDKLVQGMITTPLNGITWTIDRFSLGGNSGYKAKGIPNLNSYHVYYEAKTLPELISLLSAHVVTHNGYEGLGDYYSASVTYHTAVVLDNNSEYVYKRYHLVCKDKEMPFDEKVKNLKRLLSVWCEYTADDQVNWTTLVQRAMLYE